MKIIGNTQENHMISYEKNHRKVMGTPEEIVGTLWENNGKHFAEIIGKPSEDHSMRRLRTRGGHPAR